MQLATRFWRLGSTNSRTEVAQTRTSRRVVARRVPVKARTTQRTYFRGVVARSSGGGHSNVPSHEELITPVPADTYKHLEIPADLRADATALRKDIQKWEAEEARVIMVDLVQTLAVQVGMMQRAADHLSKDIRDVTAIDVATHRLHEHEQFVSNVQLDKVVLFSHETALENFRTGAKAIAQRYPNGKMPADIQAAISSAEATLAERVADQEIVELNVTEEVYQHTQTNLFPSFVKKGVTPQDYLDYLGGSDGLIDPVTFHVRDKLVALEKAGSEQREALLADLEKNIVAFEDAAEETSPDDDTLLSISIAQNAAELKLATAVGRRVVMGDMMPERRLERSLEISHPLLDEAPVLYAHGDVTNVREATEQMLKEEAPTVEFTARADFNPPSHFRELTQENLKLEPELANYLQKEALDFPLWEGPEAGSAINGAELIVEMKLYRLFNYMYPVIGDSAPAQKMFMDLYDISPGEATLEWALSFPTKEHTFFPEHPMWVHVYEDDEEAPAIVWPEYTPITIEGRAEISSAHNSENATIRFLPHTKDHVQFEAAYNHVFASLPIEKRFATAPEEIHKAITGLSAADKQKAEQAWTGLSPTQKQVARHSWTLESSSWNTPANIVKHQEALVGLQKRIADSSKL